jgi:pimeloyl-ACP methyl ester carboxylesterase
MFIMFSLEVDRLTTATTTGSREQVFFFHDVDVVDRQGSSLGPLASRHDVVVPAYPGFEGHQDDVDGAWREWDSAADLALHFRSSHGPAPSRRPRVLGAGFGGWVALELALLAPEQISALVLVAPYGVKLFDRTTRDFADVLLLDPPEQIALGWADPARCRGLRMPGFPDGLPDEQHQVAFDERAVLARYAWKPFLHNPRLGRWLHTITTPTLIVQGEHDQMVAPGHGQELAARMPHARFVEIPDAGHYPYLEQPDAFADVVGDFWASLDQAVHEGARA